MFCLVGLDEDDPELIIDSEKNNSVTNGAKVLPGNAWMRNKRAQVIAIRKKSEGAIQIC